MTAIARHFGTGRDFESRPSPSPMLVRWAIPSVLLLLVPHVLGQVFCESNDPSLGRNCTQSVYCVLRCTGTAWELGRGAGQRGRGCSSGAAMPSRTIRSRGCRVGGLSWRARMEWRSTACCISGATDSLQTWRAARAIEHGTDDLVGLQMLPPSRTAPTPVRST